jgi:hypothetical protein
VCLPPLKRGAEVRIEKKLGALKMAPEVKALKADEFYVVVDQFTDHPESGELMLKRPCFRTKFLAVNAPAFTDANQIAHSPIKVMVDPDETNGVYSVVMSDGYSGEKSAIMKFKVKQYPDIIIGPFETQREALLAKHIARPQTDNERIGKLESDGAAKDDELALLRERIAVLDSGPTAATQGPTPPPTKNKDKNEK